MINGQDSCPRLQRRAARLRRPRLPRAPACPVCGESVGRTPALCCAQCTCGPFHSACALPGGRTPKCPKYAQPAAARFTGAVAPAASGPRENVVLAGSRGHGAGGKEPVAASGSHGSVRAHRTVGPQGTRRHNRPSQKKDCGAACICQHIRRKSTRKDCGGASICPHNRIRSQ